MGRPDCSGAVWSSGAIEIKLVRNAEARRAVVAQVLTYAAYLYGVSPTVFERDVLGRHLQERGHDTLANVIASIDQEGAFDAEEFAAGLEESLSQGRFRLVIVLDAAPEELIRLIGYLEVVSDKLLIDVVTVASYDVGGSAILVPQRVDPERRTEIPNLFASRSVPEEGWSMEQMISWRLSTGPLLRNNQNCTDLPSGR